MAQSTTVSIFGLLIVGLCAGYLSRLAGVGGGIIIVPALVRKVFAALMLIVAMKMLFFNDQ